MVHLYKASKFKPDSTHGTVDTKHYSIHGAKNGDPAKLNLSRLGYGVKGGSREVDINECIQIVVTEPVRWFQVEISSLYYRFKNTDRINMAKVRIDTVYKDGRVEECVLTGSVSTATKYTANGDVDTITFHTIDHDGIPANFCIRDIGLETLGVSSLDSCGRCGLTNSEYKEFDMSFKLVKWLPKVNKRVLLCQSCLSTMLRTCNSSL